MFFAAFYEIQRNQQSRFSAFRSRLTFTFSVLLILSFCFLLHNMITLNGFIFSNIPTVTFTRLELWRLFSSPFATLDGIYGFLSIIVSFWWLVSLFPGYERKYSSVYLMVQVCIQNLLVQILYSVIVSILVRNTYFYQSYNQFFFSIGWMPIVIIWIFKYTGENKDEKVNFCFFPFLMKNKYVAWVISIVMILLTMQKLPLIVAALLGALQFHLCHSSFNKLPLCFYKCLDKLFCVCKRCCGGFVSIQEVEHNLSSLLGYKSQKLLQQTRNQFGNDNMAQDYGNLQQINGKNRKPSQIQMMQKNQPEKQQNQQIAQNQIQQS